MQLPQLKNTKMVLCGTCLLVLAFLPPLRNGHADDSTAKNLVAVRVLTVAQQELTQSTVQPATVHAYYQTTIRPRVTGYVVELKVDMGDPVQAGDVLAIIDVPELEQQREVILARVARDEALLASAQSQVTLAQANVVAAEARVARAGSETGRVKASVAAAEADFNRTSELVQRQSLQARMLDESRKRRDAELASVDSVEASVDSAKAEVDVAKANVAAAEAGVRAAAAVIEIAEKELSELDVMLGYAVIRAPFSGIVTKRDVELGDLVRSHAGGHQDQGLFVLSQTDRVRVRIAIPENEAAFVRAGDAIQLSFPFFADEPSIQGMISRVAGMLDPDSRTMWVESEMTNEQGKLIVGMFGQATITRSAARLSAVLPARAVRFDEKGNAFVYAIDDSSTVEVVPVETGRDSGSEIEIRSGLQPGQRIVDANLSRLATGQKVRVLAN